MKIYKRKESFRVAILVSLCLLACSATLRAQYVGYGTSVTLRPVDTGRKVGTYDNSRDSRYAPRTPRAPRISPAIRGGDRFAIKTDLIYALVLQAPNLAFEYAISPRGSIEAVIGYNGWNNWWDYTRTGPAYDPNNHYKRRLDHLFVKADYRYWLSSAFDGHFVSGGLFFARYRAGDFNFLRILDKGYDHFGHLFGVGFSYGYLWRWADRWGAEFSLGLGVASLRHDKGIIMSSTDGFTVANPVREKKMYVGPTGAAVKLVFFIN